MKYVISLQLWNERSLWKRIILSIFCAIRFACLRLESSGGRFFANNLVALIVLGLARVGEYYEIGNPALGIDSIRNLLDRVSTLPWKLVLQTE